MWSELFLLNRDELVRQMDLFSEKFELMRNSIANGDRETIRQMMRLSTERRKYFDVKKRMMSHEHGIQKKNAHAAGDKGNVPDNPRACREKKITDVALRKIFTGEDDRLLLVIGPCSADREDSVLDYISRLRTVQEKVADKILIVPRVYTNKPRTTGDGYKGMLHQPDPNSSPDMLRGLIAIRKMHMKVIAETGFSCADEMLYPENHHYLSDMLSYVAVGARSAENQLHRLTASGLDLPVGMKTPPAAIFPL